MWLISDQMFNQTFAGCDMLRFAAVSRSPAAMRSEAVSRVQRLKSRVELLFGFVRFSRGCVGVLLLVLLSSSCFVRRRRSSSVVALVSCFVVARGCCCWVSVVCCCCCCCGCFAVPVVVPVVLLWLAGLGFGGSFGLALLHDDFKQCIATN